MRAAFPARVPAAVRSRTIAVQDACWCGQALDAYPGAGCPRCGTRLRR